jgi:hypothetical protein
MRIIGCTIAARLSRQRRKQCLCTLPVGRVEALGEAGIDRHQENAGGVLPALLLPQMAHTHAHP